MAIRGITFSKQTVSSNDDSHIYKILLGGKNGKTKGCTMTFGTDDIFVSSGYFFASNRLIEISSVETVSTPVVSSGTTYCRLVFEIDLSQLVEKLLSSGVKVSSPKWNGEGYTLSRIRSLKAEDLSYGPMNVPESKYVDLVAFEEVDAYIVPGLAFSSSGCRIGYGGGWYDRMLQKASLKALKIGVCYSCQKLSSLPIETHDIAMDLVISE
jgi:5-formyltetrahydrofolate cyclo-ligase